MDISAFNPPDYGLIDDDPLTFKQQFQAFIDALTAYQSGQGDAEAVNAQLHTQVEELGARLANAEQQAQLHLEATEAAKTALNIAVAAYRQAVLNGDPSVPPALVQGETIEDVDAALAKARGVVDYVRDKLQSQGGAGVPGQTAVSPVPPPRVPAGAPGRTLPDVSAMSAREKLVFGTSHAAAG